MENSDHTPISKEDLTNWVKDILNKKKLNYPAPPGIHVVDPQHIGQPLAPVAEEPVEYDVIVVNDSSHENINQVIIDPEAHTLTAFLPEGLHYADAYDASRVALAVQKEVYTLNARTVLATNIVLHETKTCKYFSPDQSTADTFEGLEPSSEYDFNRLANFPACSNEVMRQGSDQAVIGCNMAQTQFYCSEYTLEEPVVTVAFKSSLGVFKVLKERRGLGMVQYSVAQYDSDNQVAKSDQVFTGETALESALEHLKIWSTELGSGELYEIPVDAPSKEKESYFDKILEYAK